MIKTNFLIIIFLLALAVMISSCAQGGKKEQKILSRDKDSVILQESSGRVVRIPARPKSIVAADDSLDELWRFCGGKSSGVFMSGKRNSRINADKSLKVLGTVNEPDIEKVEMLGPELIIVREGSAADDILGGYFAMRESTVLRLRTASLNDYLFCMKLFSLMNASGKLYEERSKSMRLYVERIKGNIRKDGRINSILLLRSGEEGERAETSGSSAEILRDLGFRAVSNESQADAVVVLSESKKAGICGGLDKPCVVVTKGLLLRHPGLNFHKAYFEMKELINALLKREAKDEEA